MDAVQESSRGGSVEPLAVFGEDDAYAGEPTTPVMLAPAADAAPSGGTRQAPRPRKRLSWVLALVVLVGAVSLALIAWSQGGASPPATVSTVSAARPTGHRETAAAGGSLTAGTVGGLGVTATQAQNEASTPFTPASLFLVDQVEGVISTAVTPRNALSWSSPSQGTESATAARTGEETLCSFTLSDRLPEAAGTADRLSVACGTPTSSKRGNELQTVVESTVDDALATTLSGSGALAWVKTELSISVDEAVSTKQQFGRYEFVFGSEATTTTFTIESLPSG